MDPCCQEKLKQIDHHKYLNQEPGKATFQFLPKGKKWHLTLGSRDNFLQTKTDPYVQNGYSVQEYQATSKDSLLHVQGFTQFRSMIKPASTYETFWICMSSYVNDI